MDTATTSDKNVYEVQELRNGDWSFVCSYLSQTEAVDEVKTMVERNQDVEARIVREAFDDTKNLYVKRCVFRSQPPIDQRKLQEKQQKAVYSRRSAQAKTQRHKKARQRAEQAAQRRAARRNLTFYARMLLLVALIGGGGLAALYALFELR